MLHLTFFINKIEIENFYLIFGVFQRIRKQFILHECDKIQHAICFRKVLPKLASAWTCCLHPEEYTRTFLVDFLKIFCSFIDTLFIQKFKCMIKFYSTKFYSLKNQFEYYSEIKERKFNQMFRKSNISNILLIYSWIVKKINPLTFQILEYRYWNILFLLIIFSNQIYILKIINRINIMFPFIYETLKFLN